MMHNINLLVLIEQIQKGETENFLISASVNIEYDLIDIYTKEKLEASSEVTFFNAEEIPNEILIDIDGIEYQNVCPLNMLEDIVNDLIVEDSNIDSFELTNKVLSYLEKDA